jgi:ABC-type multidrug transport system ATPase subunit
MSRLCLKDFALVDAGPRATLSLDPGESLVLLGPSGSGKTFFLASLVGQARSKFGSVEVPECEIAGLPPGRRLKPLKIAKSEKRGIGQGTYATEALSATGLWNYRQHLLSDLTPSQAAACELLPVLASRAPMLVVDGQLDRLDDWALHSVLELLKRRLSAGCILVVATNRLDLARHFEYGIILRQSQIRYAGLLSGLGKGEPQTVVVETRSQQAVRAVTKPLEITVKETTEGVLLRTADGQKTSAQLLMQGYGDIRATLLRPVSLVEEIRRLIERP